MNIVLIGPPASGKGTQASKLAKTLNLYHFQTGQLARDLAQKDPRIRKIVDSGELIPQKEMTKYVIYYLKTHLTKPDGIVFEGYPRFISQYKDLKEFLVDKGGDIDVVISLMVGEEEAVKRISSRRVCSKCGRVYNLITNPPPQGDKCECGGKLVQREDDEPESVRTRFQYYHDNTKELVNFLQKKGLLISVDGERSIEAINKDLIKIVERRIGGKD
ncbi:nucleoside monophosphate kinase [Candidatus Woesebacteria bacterium]|nr:nucleoside monophosphate kinase [Candidatus Woesebacteria bacterium]